MTAHAKVGLSGPPRQNNLFKTLTTVKSLAGVAMLFVVVTGAFGYGETVQLYAAATGLFLALGLKKINLIG